MKSFNKINFSYYFSASFLSLLAVFVYLSAAFTMPVTTISLQTPQQLPQEAEITGTYVLEPQPSRDIRLPISKTGKAITLSVLLKDNSGMVITDQSQINYEWAITGEPIIKLEALQRPNLMVQITALKAGETTINIKAKQTTDQQILAETNFNLKVVSEEAVINFQFKFKGINAKPVNAGDQLVKITATNPSLSDPALNKFTIDKNSASVDNNGIYHAGFSLAFGFLDKPGYKLCIKGPKHLQKCFSNITFHEDQNYDFTANPLEPGDLALPQDGIVNDKDLNYLESHLNTTDPAVLAIADLNLDNSLNMGDVLLLEQTLASKGDEE